MPTPSFRLPLDDTARSRNGTAHDAFVPVLLLLTFIPIPIMLYYPLDTEPVAGSAVASVIKIEDDPDEIDPAHTRSRLDYPRMSGSFSSQPSSGDKSRTSSFTEHAAADVREDNFESTLSFTTLEMMQVRTRACYILTE